VVVCKKGGSTGGKLESGKMFMEEKINGGEL
jgi:hypothetical protein